MKCSDEPEVHSYEAAQSLSGDCTRVKMNKQRYIGFLEKRSNPLVTAFIGSSTGRKLNGFVKKIAGVPLPFNKNESAVEKYPATPMIITTIPIKLFP